MLSLKTSTTQLPPDLRGSWLRKLCCDGCHQMLNKNWWPSKGGIFPNWPRRVVDLLRLYFKIFDDKFAFLPALNVSKLPACQLPDSELMDIAMPRSSLAWCRQAIISSSWHLIWSETSQQGLDILMWGDCQSLPTVLQSCQIACAE